MCKQRSFTQSALIGLIVLLSVVVSPVAATMYYVSPTGNDANTGIDSANAWASINWGDQQGILQPGDTVNILPGTYSLSATATITLSGIAGDPIVYRGSRAGDAVLDAGGGNFALLSIDGDYITVEGLTLRNSDDNGIDITGAGVVILKCIISHIATYGIHLTSGADNAHIYNNTFYGAWNIAVYPVASVKTTRVINNVIDSSQNGIWAPSGTVAAHNNTWLVSSPYVGGVVDSAGGVSIDPQFADPASGDFSLQAASLCIDAGMQLGYQFIGSAPDLGAIEYHPPGGRVYWVSLGGNDSNNGLDSMSAWLSIDRGEQLGVLEPGDTVNVLPGTYFRTATVLLSTAGTVHAPIVYRGKGKVRPVVNLGNAGNPGIVVDGDHTILDGFQVTNANEDGIRIGGDSCLIQHCLVFGVSKVGIRVSSSYNLIYRNVVYEVGRPGIKNEDAGEFGNLYYNNVVTSCGLDGIVLRGHAKTARVFNNIITQNGDRGIVGPVEAVCGFNNVWGNPGGNYSGVVDSAGGIAKLPKFVNAAGLRFDLQHTAFELNAGLDLGFEFNGSGPDIGAFEKYNAYYVSVAGNDSADGLSASTAWRTIDRGDTLLRPGDTVYVLPGTYSDSVVIGDSGFDWTDRIEFLGVRDSTFVDAASAAHAVSMTGSYVTWSGISVSGAVSDNFSITGTGATIREAHISGAGRWGVHSALPVNLYADVFSRNDSGGFYCAGGADGFVYNNTFYQNGPYGYRSMADDASLTNNIFVGHTSAAVYANATTDLTYSLFDSNAFNGQGGVSVGYGSIPEDPLLVDPAGDDFRLRSNSPAIDVGTDVGRTYFGTAPDLGAYEAREAIAIEITPVRDTLRADSVYQFAVMAFDAAGDPAATGELVWSHTFADGTVDAAGLFTPQSVGTGRLIVTAPDLSLADTTDLMVVVAGDLASLSISPQRDTLTTDSTRQFSAVGLDSRGNPVASLGTLSWQVWGGIGSIDISGLFNPTTVGKGIIRVASDLGVSVQSDTIVVVPGATAAIQVLPEENIQGHNEAFQYRAYGFDTDGNVVAEMTDSVTWTVTDPLGSMSSGGVYTSNPALDGTYYAIAESGIYRDSARVIVTDQLSKIQIELADGTPFGDTVLTTDVDTTHLYCRAYTILDVLIGDVTVDWSVIGNDSIGSAATSFGPGTTLLLTTPGTGQVVASDSLGRADTSGVITCSAGGPDHFLILPTVATVSADSTLTFTCQSLDADDNPSAPAVVPSWFVLGGIGSISAGGLFTPSATGTGSVVCLGGGLVDTVGPISVVPGGLSQITISPDSVVVSADDGRQFTVVGLDSHGNQTDAGTITWSPTAALGTVDSTGFFDAVTAGIGRMRAVSSLGPVDTSAFLQVLPGTLTRLNIEPDSIEVTTDSSITFTAAGYDFDGNLTSAGQLQWAVTADIGDISSSGLFTPIVVGSGQVVAYNPVENIADTNTAVIVRPGQLVRLVVQPDTATLQMGDTLSFSAIGYDASFNVTDAGVLTWLVSGGMGSINPAGLFTATSAGTGRIVALSGTYGVSDSSGAIAVEALSVTTIPIGNFTVEPGKTAAALLAFRIRNPFFNDKQIQSVTVRTALRGPGSESERLTNLTGLALYLDTDADSTLSPGDSLMAETATFDSTATFAFSPLTIAAGSGRDFFVAGRVSLTARDADSLDLLTRPSTDIVTVDGTEVVGPDSLNSLGFVVIDGMVAAQVVVSPTGTASLIPADTLYNVLTIDLPRNGYGADTLTTISLLNAGSAPASDITQMSLYVDNGDGVWGGAGTETSLGNLGYTGALWVRSGLMYPLATPVTRFYVTVHLADFPTNGATVALTIPTGGITVRSGNDGPRDIAIEPVDTIPIQTFESITVANTPIASRPVFPGDATGPMFGLTLSSSYGSAVDLDSLRVHIDAADSHGATPEQLASQVDSVLLYLNRDNNPEGFGSADSLVAVGSIAGNVVIFAPTGLAIPADGGSIDLSVGLHLTTLARDGNTLGVVLADSTDLFWNIPATVDGVFPAQNSGIFTVDAFTADQVAVSPIDGATLFGGQTNTVVLDFVLPPNGYALDSLASLRLHNIGSFNGTVDVLTFKLWVERTGAGFSVGDSLIGTFLPTSGGWVLEGLRCPIGPSGQRCYVTVSVAAVSFNAGTIRMQIPTERVVYRSGADGPDNFPISNPNVHLVVPSNRITAISVPTVSTPVSPGAAGNTVLTFALYNGYVGRDQTLTSTALTNISRSLSGADYADYELGQVSLYFDSNNNRTLDNDSLVAVGTFSDGRLLLSGLDVLLPAESLSYFFVVADLRLDAIDSDSLAVAVIGPSDFVFTEPVSINGDMPLAGGGYLIVDGSVQAQYQILPQAPRTLSPLDSGVTLLAFRPAANGDRVDTLQSVVIGNGGSATDSDLDRVALWLDVNADSVWQGSDSLLGAMNYIGGAWSLGGLHVAVGQERPTIFVVADIAAGAIPDASFRGVIPLDGCSYQSANDGPRDAALVDGNVYTISNSALQVAYTPLNGAYSVGQAIAVQFSVTNISDSVISDVVGAIVAIADSTLVTPTGGAPTPVTLGSGETAGFTFNYTAAAIGQESWQVAAFSAADTSSVIATNTTTLQQAPTSAQTRLINSIPTAVTRGQKNVFPLSLVFTHPDTALATAAIRLDSLVLTVENGAGAGLSADAVFSRLVLATGSATLTVIESVPGGSSITVPFDQPLLVIPGGEQRLSILVDIDSTATAQQFALAVASATALPFLDANSGAALSVTSPTGYPMRTAPCRIDDPSQQLAVGYDAVLGEAVNIGQQNVPIAQLNFRHPGLSGSSQIQLSSLSLQIVDALSAPLEFGELFDEVKIVRQQTTVGSITFEPAGSTTVEIALNSPLTLSPGQRDSLLVLASIKQNVTASEFAMLVADSTAFVVRDLSSGSELAATTDTSGLATGATIFPILTAMAHFHQAAKPPLVCPTAAIPLRIVGGTDSLGLFDLTVTYPYDPNFSSVRVTTVAMSVLDPSGSPLNPDRLFDRIGCRIDGGQVIYQPFVELFSGATLFRLADTGVVLGPGQTTTIRLVADIEADAPFDNFVLQIPSEASLEIQDVTDTARQVPLLIDGACGGSFPYSTGVTDILFPAGRPTFAPGQRPVQVVFAGQGGVSVLEATVAYASSTPQGALGLTGLTGRLVRNTGHGTMSTAAADVIGDLRLLINGRVLPGQMILSGDSVTVALDQSYRISRNDELDLQLVVDLTGNAPLGNYYFQFDDSSFLKIEDINTLATVYTGLSSAIYPLRSTELSVAAAGLAASFSNFPNPFNPGSDGHTTIAYVLDNDAEVDIEIFAITGERICEVIMNVPRAAGTHQEDIWEGVNGSGRLVVPGTYFCRITARYTTGEEETFRRKIAVVR